MSLMYSSSCGCCMRWNIVWYSRGNLGISWFNQPSVKICSPFSSSGTAKSIPTYSQLNRSKTLFNSNSHAFVIAAIVQHNSKGLSCCLHGNQLKVSVNNLLTSRKGIPNYSSNQVKPNWNLKDIIPRTWGARQHKINLLNAHMLLKGEMSLLGFKDSKHCSSMTADEVQLKCPTEQTWHCNTIKIIL